MNSQELRAVQLPLKKKYMHDPESASYRFKAIGELNQDCISVQIKTGKGRVKAGLHPATGGDGTLACSGDMLLEALAACAGVTLNAVATATGVHIRNGTVIAEGNLDFRGTLGVAKEVPVGFKSINLRFVLDTDADEEQLATLMRLTERYCVVHSTLSHSPDMSISCDKR